MQTRLPLPWFRPFPDDPCFCGSERLFSECCGLESQQRDPPAGVLVIRGFLSPDTCRKWVKRLQAKPIKPSTVQGIQSAGTAYLSVEQDVTRVCTEVQPGSLRKIISDRVGEAFLLAAERTGHTVEWFEAPTILRYQAGGYFMAHADSCLLDPGSHNWFKVNDRDLSLLIYLNEEFTGGGLKFVNFHYDFQPRTGDLVVFPSDNRYAHEASKVESGLRYVIVSWAALAGSERVCDGPAPGAIFLK